MNTSRLALTGVAVLAIAAIGLALYFSRPSTTGPGATTSPTPSALSTPTAGPTAFPAAGALDPRTYIAGPPFPVQISATLHDDDWWMWTDGVQADVVAAYRLSPDPPVGHGFGLLVVDSLYSDPCDGAAGKSDPGPSVDDFVTAIREQPLTTSTEPIDVTIDGYSGLYVDMTRDGTSDDCLTYTRWGTSQGPRLALVDERDQLWVLDVDGVRLIIDAFSFPGTTEDDLASMREIVENVQIQPH